MSASYRLGFDIGGTFTDFTLVNESTGEISGREMPDEPTRS